MVPSFVAPVSYRTAPGPFGLTADDLNADGTPDLVTANFGDGSGSTVSVLLGRGDGFFRSAVHYPAGGGPVFVVVNDFNRDGLRDLVTANHISNNVGVLLGNGDGTFQPARHYDAGANARALAVGDFNGDSLLDLAVANRAVGTVSVLLGNGNGSFRPPVTYGVGADTYGVATADFDRDGALDLAAANGGGNSVGVLLGNGDGTFRPPVHSPGGGVFVTVGDFNRDGIPDLVTASLSSHVTVRLGNGDGTFRPGVNYRVGAASHFVVVNDFNGDALPDLAVANADSDDVSVLLGNGDGTFESSHYPYGAGGHPWAVAAGDFNGDGFPDLATGNEVSNDVSVLLNDGIWPNRPVVHLYIYPDSGQVTAGTPFDVYVLALDALFNVVRNYTGLVWFYTTDPQATTPGLYRFQRPDQGIASFPGGVTLRTPGLQVLYVFDTATFEVIGYAVFDVVGAGPGRSGGDGRAHPAPDLFAGEALGHRAEVSVRLPDTPAVLPLDAPPPTVAHGPLVPAASAPSPAEALPPPLLDRLFARPYDRGTWDPLMDAPLAPED